MIVPTATTECYAFLMETNIGGGRPTFLAGSSGSGKTVLASLVSPPGAAECSSDYIHGTFWLSVGGRGVEGGWFDGSRQENGTMRPHWRLMVCSSNETR